MVQFDPTMLQSIAQTVKNNQEQQALAEANAKNANARLQSNLNPGLSATVLGAPVDAVSSIINGLSELPKYTNPGDYYAGGGDTRPVPIQNPVGGSQDLERRFTNFLNPKDDPNASKFSKEVTKAQKDLVTAPSAILSGLEGSVADTSNAINDYFFEPADAVTRADATKKRVADSEAYQNKLKAITDSGLPEIEAQARANGILKGLDGSTTPPVKASGKISKAVQKATTKSTAEATPTTDGKSNTSFWQNPKTLALLTGLAQGSLAGNTVGETLAGAGAGGLTGLSQYDAAQAEGKLKLKDEARKDAAEKRADRKLQLEERTANRADATASQGKFVQLKDGRVGFVQSVNGKAEFHPIDGMGGSDGSPYGEEMGIVNQLDSVGLLPSVFGATLEKDLANIPQQVKIQYAGLSDKEQEAQVAKQRNLILARQVADSPVIRALALATLNQYHNPTKNAVLNNVLQQGQ